VEIGPCIQHFQGGVKIREKGNTSLKGLYAAGECAGGQHGANRPGGNALLDGQVFGKISGREAALEAINLDQKPSIPSHNIDRILSKFNPLKNGKKASDVRKLLQSITSSYASVVRTPEELREGLKRLDTLRREGLFIDKKEPIYALETENLLDVAEMVLKACLARKESRGPHLFFNRFDDPRPLPSQDPKWRKYIVIQNRSGKMVLRKKAPVKLNYHDI